MQQREGSRELVVRASVVFGFRVQGSGLKVQGYVGIDQRVQGLGFKGLGFRVESPGFGVWGDLLVGMEQRVCLERV